MWFKFYNRKNFALRFFRSYNMRYDHDVHNIYAFHHVSKLNNLFQRVIFTDSTMRGVNHMLMISMLSFFMYYKEQTTTEEDIQKEKDEKDKIVQKDLEIIKNELRLNR